MFCYQCGQTSRNKCYTGTGVCGKTDITAEI